MIPLGSALKTRVTHGNMGESAHSLTTSSLLNREAARTRENSILKDLSILVDAFRFAVSRVAL